MTNNTLKRLWHIERITIIKT